MDHSTEGVTLLTQYVVDVLEVVEQLGYSTEALYVLVANHDLKNPYAHLPMSLYNTLCDKVEELYGEKVIREVGLRIGQTAFQILQENGVIAQDPSVCEVMEGIEIAAETTISDPQNRGWEILESSPKQMRMRRTQTFHSKLQLGLLRGLAAQSPEVLPDSVMVVFAKQVAQGDEFDEYLITWKSSQGELLPN